MVKPRGRPDRQRRQKKMFKPKKKKSIKLDPETRDLKDYLDPVIYATIV